jgi:hypothetical protein
MNSAELFAKLQNRRKQIGEEDGSDSMSLPLSKVQVHTKQVPPKVADKPSVEKVKIAIANVSNRAHCVSGSMATCVADSACIVADASKCNSIQTSVYKYRKPEFVILHENLEYTKQISQWYAEAICYSDADLDVIHAQLEEYGCTISSNPY